MAALCHQPKQSWSRYTGGTTAPHLALYGSLAARQHVSEGISASPVERNSCPTNRSHTLYSRFAADFESAVAANNLCYIKQIIVTS
jgi:hypothetical protein